MLPGPGSREIYRKWGRRKPTNLTGVTWGCGPRDDIRRTRGSSFYGNPLNFHLLTIQSDFKIILKA